MSTAQEVIERELDKINASMNVIRRLVRRLHRLQSMGVTAQEKNHIKKLANIKLSELRKHPWWNTYENGVHPQPRQPVVEGLKQLFPEFADAPYFNFHWDKRHQLNTIKVYARYPKGGENGGEGTTGNSEYTLIQSDEARLRY